MVHSTVVHPMVVHVTVVHAVVGERCNLIWPAVACQERL